MKTSSRPSFYFLALLILGLLFSFSAPAHANVFTGKLEAADKKPQLTVTVKDKDGKPRTLKVIVDTGNSNGIGVNKATAAALGLTEGTDVPVRGAGGVATFKNTSFTGDKEITVQNVTTPPGQTDTALKISGRGIIGFSLPNDTLLLGQDFLKNFVQTIHPKTGELTLTALDQLDKKPAVSPRKTPIRRRTDANFNPIDELVKLGLGTGVKVDGVTQEFVIGTGNETSLITEALALELGLILGDLPIETFPSYVGDVPIWRTDLLPYILFPDDLGLANSFGILPDSFNPDRINILGTDILSGYGVYQIDLEDDLLRAGVVVPEPSTMLLSLMGLVGASLGPALRKKPCL